jgi:DNA-binding transcriptional ArsR family regulator
METPLAVAALSALAHEGRLTIFRQLVQAGPDGLAAGVLARSVGVAPNTLSNSLTVLLHAGLVAARRDGRSIIYTARYERMSELLSFLMQDCCNGSPQVCAPLAGIVSQAACCPQPSPEKASA